MDKLIYQSQDYLVLSKVVNKKQKKVIYIMEDKIVLSIKIKMTIALNLINYFIKNKKNL